MATYSMGPDGWLTFFADTGTGLVYLDEHDDIGRVVDDVRSGASQLGIEPAELTITLQAGNQLLVTTSGDRP